MTQDPETPKDGVAPPRCLIAYGPLRGGTTMLRLMLNGHSRMACIGESDWVVDFLRRDGAGWHYDLDRLEEDRIFRASGLRLPEAGDARAALEGVLAEIAGGKPLPVLMLHHGIERAVELLGPVPILRFTRDPRDSARSAIGMGWAGHVYGGAEPWMRTEDDWTGFVADGPDNPIHVLRYEDLLADPEARLREVCGFAGFDYDPDMLSYPETTTYDAPDARLAYQWRRKLSDREVALVEARIGARLAQSGYEASGVAPVALSAWDIRWLGLTNRIAIWKSLVARFGVVAPVLRGIGRRLGLRRLVVAAQRSMDVKTKRRLK
jgi:hypothetical protein